MTEVISLGEFFLLKDSELPVAVAAVLLNDRNFKRLFPDDVIGGRYVVDIIEEHFQEQQPALSPEQQEICQTYVALGRAVREENRMAAARSRPEPNLNPPPLPEMIPVEQTKLG